MPILPSQRDPRLTTVRRGGTLSDEDHRLLAAWAIGCAEHVLPLFEAVAPDDTRPRDALEAGRAWIRGELRMSDSRQAAFGANAAAREKPDPARLARSPWARPPRCRTSPRTSSAQPRTPSVQRGRRPSPQGRTARRPGGRSGTGSARGCPNRVRALVLDDQRQRSSICWGAFDD